MSSAFQDNIARFRNNPSAIMRTMITEIENARGKALAPDPTNPFVWALEAQVALAYDNLTQMQSNLQYVYPRMATTWAQLYNHMSDVDFRDVFSKPGSAPYTFFFDLEELYSKVVPVPNTNTSKLVIPAKSKFTIAETTFLLLHPIEIRVKSGTSINVVYDVSNPSPLEKITNNIVDWKITSFSGRNHLALTVPVMQLNITPKIAKITNATGLDTSYQFPDQYHYCRAFRADGNGGWIEMVTSHTIQVFDPTVPTVLLRVEGNTLYAHIPPIYFTNGLVSDSVKLDIYSCKGNVVMELNNYNANSFTAVWGTDDTDRNIYTAPINTFSDMAVLGHGILSGGRNGVTFEELRERVINGTLKNIDVPITDVQLQDNLQDLGYSVVTSVDTLTSRIFQATRPLPQPDNQSTISGIGGRIGSVYVTMDTLPDYGTVRDNGERMTILPTTLYYESNGIIKPDTLARTQAIQALPPEEKIAEVMGNNFLYSPYHYVLDSANNQFEVRPYYLDKPLPTDKYFIAENDTTGLSVSTGALSIEKVDDGYLFYITTLSGAAFKQLDPTKIIVQLSYTPTGENLQAHMLGEYVGVLDNEFVFMFHMTTNFDINANDDILLTSFKMIDFDTNRNLPTPLITEFDVRYAVMDYTTSGMEYGPITSGLATFMIQEEYESLVGLSSERVTIEFGSALSFGRPPTGLWSKSRTLLTEEDYEKYETDVYWTYENDVYEMIPGTNSILYTEVEENGEMVLKRNKLYSAGDIQTEIVSGEEVPKIRFLAGTTKVDIYGNPIIKNPRKLRRELNLFLLDGAYYFADEPETVAYRNTVPQYLIDWLSNDIVPLSRRTHEESELFYYPQTTIGRVDVIVDGADREIVESEQIFTVRLYVNRATYTNTPLRLSITDQVKTVLADMVAHSTVSYSTIIATMRETIGEVVLSITVEGLGGSLEASQITMVDDSQRLTIGKALVLRQDGYLSIEDNINVDFILHQTS